MVLKDRVAVVTGGGSGIGAAICQEYAIEGARVAVVDINLEMAEEVANEIISSGGRAMAVKLDVSDSKAVEQATQKIAKELGTVDIWVNSAGISRIMPFLDHTEDVWNQTLNINLKGSFFCCQSAVRQMLAKKKGVIINMSSQSGKAGNSQYQAYCSSKFGVIGLTQSLAMEFAKDGIRVNAICPGVVWTPMWDLQVADYAKKRNLKPEEVKEYFESKIPMGRVAKAREIARVAVFLASDDSSYITGQALNLCGGTIME